MQSWANTLISTYGNTTHTLSYKLPWWFMGTWCMIISLKAGLWPLTPPVAKSCSPSVRSHPYSRPSSSSLTSVCLIHRSSPSLHLYSLPSPSFFMTFSSQIPVTGMFFSLSFRKIHSFLLSYCVIRWITLLLSCWLTWWINKISIMTFMITINIWASSPKKWN